MTALEQLRAAQHDEITTTADHALAAFLSGCAIELALRDRDPTTPVELRHLARARAAS
jgi:hypothetical protein